MAAGSTAFGQDEFQISGIYRSGRPCDDTSARRVLVTISPEQIVHPGGVCAIEDRKRQDDTVVLRVACRDKRGKVLSGEVSFTIRDDKTLDMTALDGSYKAVLNRCSEPSTRAQSESRVEPAAAR